MALKRQAGEIRLDTRDYEYAESRTMQINRARVARKRLQHLRTDIVTASEYGIFSPVDVVQLSTWIDSLFDQVV